ncbi:MAG: hypothetical protein WCP01_04080, partial [Methylococcaceae bacterium]
MRIKPCWAGLAKLHYPTKIRARGGVCNPAPNVWYLPLVKKLALGMVSCCVRQGKTSDTLISTQSVYSVVLIKY